MTSSKIRVLVVDDSLFMRRLISDMLNSDPEIEVIDTAKDSREAIKKIAEKRPGVITLDLAMPGQNGLLTLKQIMSEYPTPVIIISAYSREDADITIQCLEAGAVGFILKPSGELSLNIEIIRQQLLVRVKAAAQITREKVRALSRDFKKPKRWLRAINKIIVIGASTGGPQALEQILSALPGNFPLPIILIQHMPSRFFTDSLAEHLNKICTLKVIVPEHNQLIEKGKVYLAPAEAQMTVRPRSSLYPSPHPSLRPHLYPYPHPPHPHPHRYRQAEDGIICLLKDPSPYLGPSIDLTMTSVAVMYGQRAIGIILSGLGEDGREGMKAIKDHGGQTIVQDESSLMFSMPKAVIENGHADKILPIYKIVEEVLALSSDEDKEKNINW